MPWYIQKSDKALGPFEDSQLKGFVVAKRIGKETKVSQSSTGPWLPASQVKGLFPEAIVAAPQPAKVATAEPPPIPKVSTIKHQAQAAIPRLRAGQEELKKLGGIALQTIDIEDRKEKARQTLSLYKLFWTRVLKSDFSVIRASSEEASELMKAANPVSSSQAQDYASWRRSLLMISLLMLSVSLLLNVFKIGEVLTSDQQHFITKFQTFFLFFFQLAASVLCLLAARDWCNLQRSRSWARFAWLTQFLGPFLVFLVPLSVFISDKFVLLNLGVFVVLTLSPKIFGLFPGLIRCSLTVKTLLPETATAGWLAIIIAPLYAMFLVVAAIIALQVNEKLLGIGLALIAAGMSVVVMYWERLLRPADQAEASKAVGMIKHLQKVFQIAGISCIGVFVFNNAEIQFAWFNRLLLFVFSLIGNVTLLTVVMSDFLLAMIYKEHQRSAEFAGTEMARSLADRLTDLSACGLTDLRAGEAELAAGLRSHGGRLASETVAKGNQFFRQVGQQATAVGKESPPLPDTRLHPSLPDVNSNSAKVDA